MCLDLLDKIETEINKCFFQGLDGANGLDGNDGKDGRRVSEVFFAFLFISNFVISLNSSIKPTTLLQTFIVALLRSSFFINFFILN